MPKLDSAAVDTLLARARKEVDEGLLPGCQLALALDGEVVVEAAFGDATVDSRFTIFSATKAFVASVVWQLIGEGLLDPAQKVDEVLPGFGANGKEDVTLEHVLLHTSGFPMAPLGPPKWDTHEGRAAVLSSWRLNWPLGSRFEYHPTSAHWVLAEMIHAVTGLDHTEALRTRVLEPLGLKSFQLGPTADEGADVLDVVPCGDPASPDELQATLGISAIDVGEVTEAALQQLNDPSRRAIGLPGGGGVSTASDVTRFYQALLRNEGGLWDADVLADVTSVVRNTFPDLMLGHPVNRSRGLVIAGGDGKSNLRGMGRTVSPGAFGHNGAGGQIAWADPATGLSFSYLTNGLDRNFLREHRRTTALGSLAAVCAV